MADAQRRSQYADVIDSFKLGEDARHIEGYLRAEVGTLDHLDRERLKHYAREMIPTIELDRQLAEDNARSYGL